MKSKKLSVLDLSALLCDLLTRIFTLKSLAGQICSQHELLHCPEPACYQELTLSSEQKPFLYRPLWNYHKISIERLVLTKMSLSTLPFKQWNFLWGLFSETPLQVLIFQTFKGCRLFSSESTSHPTVCHPQDMPFPGTFYSHPKSQQSQSSHKVFVSRDDSVWWQMFTQFPSFSSAVIFWRIFGIR